jgi:hypothetical protein
MEFMAMKAMTRTNKIRKADICEDQQLEVVWLENKIWVKGKSQVRAQLEKALASKQKDLYLIHGLIGIKL